MTSPLEIKWPFAAAVLALAASGSAIAQSSVTLYGIADAFVGKKSTGVGAARVSRNVVDSDGMANSRWGLRGRENLGGGLSANFQLESLFDITTGGVTQVTTAPASAPSSQLFSSQAWVGVSGGFGDLRLGRQVSPFHSFVGLTNNLYDATAFSTTGTVWAMGNLPNYIGRFDNAVSYESPTFNGVSGKVALGFGEDKTAVATASKNSSLNIKYVQGPIVLGYSFQQQGAQGVVAKTKYNLIGGSYNFGVAMLVADFNTARRGNLKDSEWQVGVNVPFGAASIALGYASTKGNDVGAGSNNKGSGLALLGTYDMSKRTRLYAGLRKATGKNSAGALTTDTQTVGLGIIHRF